MLVLIAMVARLNLQVGRYNVSWFQQFLTLTVQGRPRHQPLCVSALRPAGRVEEGARVRWCLQPYWPA